MKWILSLFLVPTAFLQAESSSLEAVFARALVRGDVHTIENLLSSGMDPDLPDRYGQTPLSLALSSRQTGVVELLLAWHADPNRPLKHDRNDTGEFPGTPLQAAAQSGVLRLASILIAAGADIHATGTSGRTALHYAGNQLDMIRFLVEKGADVNARDREGASPLDDAVWTGSVDAAALLLAHGARLNEQETQTGATPLNEAAYRGQASLVRYLLQFHPDLEIPDKKGHTALDNAIRMKKEDCAQLLLDAQPKAQLTAGALESMLETAIAKDEQRVVETLLQKGADPNRSSTHGTTPLEDASLLGLVSIAGTLLDHGASVNQINTASGTTALYAAASFGKSGVVELLLQRGADPSLCGRSHNTPYQAAVANGYSGVAEQIVTHAGAKTCQP